MITNILDTRVNASPGSALKLQLFLHEPEDGRSRIILSLTRGGMTETVFTPEELSSIAAQVFACVEGRRLVELEASKSPFSKP